MLYNRIKIIDNSLHEIIPLYSLESQKRRKIVLINCATDKSYYKEIYNIYGVSLLRYQYGINKYLSDLYMYTNGFNKRTMYYFVGNIFSIQSFYPFLNKLVYASHMAHLKKKFGEHTYWSISYMNKYPCRGQRRRSNASTAHKLHILSRFSVSRTTKKAHIVVKAKKNKKQAVQKRSKR